MNQLVKILVDDCGEVIENAKWCLSIHDTGNMAFCSGQFYGEGESACKYEFREIVRGGITCENCLDKIKRIKSVKL